MMTLTGCPETMNEVIALPLDTATLQRLARNKMIQKTTAPLITNSSSWPVEMSSLDA